MLQVQPKHSEQTREQKTGHRQTVGDSAAMHREHGHPICSYAENAQDVLILKVAHSKIYQSFSEFGAHRNLLEHLVLIQSKYDPAGHGKGLRFCTSDKLQVMPRPLVWHW